MKKLILMLFALISSVGAFAEVESATLVVEQNDKTVYRFYLPEKKPVLSFKKGRFVIDLSSSSGETSSITIERDNVKNIYFENGNTGTKSIANQKQDVAFNILQPGIITVSGLTAGDQIMVVRADGRSLINSKASSEGKAMIDLSGQKHGTYIISINKRFTYKYMKP